MKIKLGVLAGVTVLLCLFAAIAVAGSSNQQNDPISGSSTQQSDQQTAALSNDPQTVMQVQQALSDRGYFQGAADGKWNSKTQDALKQFQTAQGINANGQLDQQTLASLGIQAGSAAGGQQDMSSQGSGAGGAQSPQQSNQPGGSKY